MSSWFNIVKAAFFGMLELLWFGKRKIANSLNIYIKTNAGNTLSVELDPKSDIKNLKEMVAPRMGIAPEDIKIIFAGKELRNCTVIEECDLGQQSIIHAIQIPHKRFNTGKASRDIEEVMSESMLYSTNTIGSKPMNETLRDLPLDELNQRLLEEQQQKNRAHFYVYCSAPCKTMTVGKLRVKCTRCGSGAVTVDRDPQCWPDVLQSRRITVHCENDSCFAFSPCHNKKEEPEEITYAQFYFKCAQHVSLGENDQAVPLYLIKSNTWNIPCLACTDIRETVLVFPCTSGHVICIECFREYCTVRLQERRFEFDSVEGYYTLPCPAGCPDSFIKEVHHFHLLTIEQYERYQRFSTEEYVLQVGGLLCPRPNCGMGIIPCSITEDKECQKMQCIGGCGYVFCRKCLQGYHIGECKTQILEPSTSFVRDYSVDPLKANDAKWEEASKKMIQISTKPCPKCRTPTERDGGCMHMVCTRARCGYQWCWMCQSRWTRDCMANHWFG